MRNQVQFGLMGFFFICGMLLIVIVEAQTCKPSGRLRGTQAPKDKCDPSVDDCCQANKLYTVYKCSPPVSGHTKAILTINNFEKGGDGGGPAECDNLYHSNKLPVVALSTGWFNGKTRCNKNITIFGNGRSTKAMVVDECDSAKGCDDDHGYQLPCRNHIVDASQAVWEALKVPKDNWGEMDIFWADDDN